MYQKHLLEYKIDFVSDIFAVAVVQLENEGEFFEQFTEAEYALALVAVTNVAEEIFTNEGHSCYWLRMDDTQLALVVSIFDMNADMEYSQVLWEQTAQRIFDLVSGSCSIGRDEKRGSKERRKTRKERREGRDPRRGLFHPENAGESHGVS